MSHAALTQRYRPQTFADVAGQATLKAILSRASAEDRVAPAYLFSGTRGVGKTTIARIFAKALNCKSAPAPEPCNHCENCRAIAAGGFIDVVEIDGASHTGVDDIRSLKENVGYAPMDGRYKIFIIDEAHMLSKSAFNALLKTLEEPPARVTFIMATTEPHKFPATIISRCQHYVFKRLSDAELEAHLTKILGMEKLLFEAAALRLIVRRAAGSVRDAMSLLGQVLALGGEALSEADTRMVLGLAGQELFFKLLSHIKLADCPALSLLVREMLDQGLDLGFFLRELALMWRNLFMLRQAGEAARSVVDLPEAEVERWLAEAKTFELGHIHAAWQMSLEGQRRVLNSLEPALALELLLLNLAMLPKLLSMEQVSMLSRKFGSDTAEKKKPITELTEGAASKANMPLAPDEPAFAPLAQAKPAFAALNVTEPTFTDSKGRLDATHNSTHNLTQDLAPQLPLDAAQDSPSQLPFGVAQDSPSQRPEEPSGPAEQALPDPNHTGSPDDAKLPDPAAVFAPAKDASQTQFANAATANATTLQINLARPDKHSAAEHFAGAGAVQLEPSAGAEKEQAVPNKAGRVFAAGDEHLTIDDKELAAAGNNTLAGGNNTLAAGNDTLAAGAVLLEVNDTIEALGAEGDWEGFINFCGSLAGTTAEIPASFTPLLNKVTATWQGGAISITPPDAFSAGLLENETTFALIKSLASRFCGSTAAIRLLPPPDREADKAKLRAHLEEIPAIKALKNSLGAEIVDYAPWNN